MAHTALNELLALAAVVRPNTGAIDIHGDDPVFPTRFKIGTTGAAAIAASAIAADELWALRCAHGQRQAISIDVRHAAAAMRSARYLQIDGATPTDLFDPVSGLYRGRD